MSNNNNNHNSDKKVSVKRDWKIYVSLALYALLGLAIGYAVAKGVIYLVNKPKIEKVKVIDANVKSVATGTADFSATINSKFEGDNKGDLKLTVPANYKVSQGAGNSSKVFTVTDENGSKIATLYTYFNGGRGATAQEYIDETIKKTVSITNVVANGNWTKASNATTEYNLKSATNKNYLLYVESAKVNSDKIVKILETFDVK